MFKKFCLLGLFLCLVFSATKLRAATDGDFLLWTQFQYTHPVEGGPLNFQWIVINRFENNTSSYQQFQNSMGFYYVLVSWFNVGIFFDWVKESDKTGEFRIYPQATFSTKVGHWKFAGRHRFENRLTNEYRFRYRLYILMGRKFNTKPVTLTPYIGNEIFLETGKGFNQNRAQIGNSFGFLKEKVRFVLYFMLRSDDKSAGWIHRYVLGTTLKVVY